MFQGFVAELAKNYQRAERSYRASLTTPVDEEASYYAHVDLARIALKRGELKVASDHLSTFLRKLSLEIRLGHNEDVPPDSAWLGYVPDSVAVAGMERDRGRLTEVLEQLRALSPKRKP